ncbi:MAG: LysM peptidoglycan-binding domain-containing protein [Thermoleophilia bacterium]
MGLLLAILSLVLVVGLRAAPDSQGGQEPQTYIVQPGDSLWNIAEHTSAGDPRDMVGRIEELNHLSSSTIQAGQTLLLPAS